MIRDINSTNPDQHLSHTKNILCTAGLVPSGYDSLGPSRSKGWMPRLPAGLNTGTP